MKSAISLLVFALILMIAATALLYTQQRRLIFPAPSQYPQAPPPGLRCRRTPVRMWVRCSLAGWTSRDGFIC